MCLSILNEEKDWVPTITVKQVLLGIQDLLDNPNLGDPAQREAFIMCRDDRAAYIERVKSLAKSYVGAASVRPVPRAQKLARARNATRRDAARRVCARALTTLAAPPPRTFAGPARGRRGRRRALSKANVSARASVRVPHTGARGGGGRVRAERDFTHAHTAAAARSPLTRTRPPPPPWRAR